MRACGVKQLQVLPLSAFLRVCACGACFRVGRLLVLPCSFVFFRTFGTSILWR